MAAPIAPASTPVSARGWAGVAAGTTTGAGATGGTTIGGSTTGGTTGGTTTGGTTTGGSTIGGTTTGGTTTGGTTTGGTTTGLFVVQVSVTTNEASVMVHAETTGNPNATYAWAVAASTGTGYAIVMLPTRGMTSA
ncbi:hypothetical protein GY24_09855 [Microterricola pindariensis]|uniref:Uncharacterized protein n=1 Tax=Microterricola pindariensis TaxID=478010 RepID=A0ABX5AWF5_9MICO|nr:hypothetical protein GY24_09855 [Microterricola pindariensis]